MPQFDESAVRNHPLIKDNPALQDLTICTLMRQEQRPFVGAPLFAATVPGNIKEFRKNNPDAPGDILDIYSFGDIICMIDVLIDLGFVTRSLTFSDHTCADDTLPYEDIDEHDYNELMAELDKSNDAAARVAEKHNISLDEVRKHPEYQQQRGKIYNPETGIGGYDPRVNLVMEHKWTDKITRTLDNIQIALPDIQQAMEELITPEQIKAIHEKAKEFALHRANG